jgi:glycosyltransferase involved in cell wall biosynthesis
MTSDEKKLTIAGEGMLESPGAEVFPMTKEELHAAVVEEFDAEFYSAYYGDVSRAGVNPLEHYLRFGWLENRNPRRGFDGAYYRKKYLADAPRYLSPLTHYILEGQALGLPLSKEEELSRFGDRDWSALVLQFLDATGLDMSHVDGDVFHRFIMPLFSAKDYKQRKGITATMSESQLLAHYLAFDFPNGASPGSLFNTDWYVRQAQKVGLPPVTQTGGAFLHWLEHGVKNRIVPLALFCEGSYLAENPDVAEGYEGWAFEHFLISGLREERKFSPLIYLEPNKTRALAPAGQSLNEEFLTWVAHHPPVETRFEEMRHFLKSDLLADILRSASALEPQIARSIGGNYQLLPPWQDSNYADFKSIRDLIPLDSVERIILMPFCKMGGADFLAGAVAHEAGDPSETLILRTEQSDWVRPEWFPKTSTSVDLSTHLKLLDRNHRKRILYELIRSLKARHVYNVNSRLGFQTFEHYGARLKCFTRLYAYYFCSDWTPDGLEVGYPVTSFASLLPHLKAALFDNESLPTRLIERFALPVSQAAKLHVFHTPVMSIPPPGPAVHRQVASKGDRDRPVLLWAGRLDRQKRFDLMIGIARALPEVDFHCWGRAVLDAPMVDMVELPENLTLNPPFDRFSELPLSSCDGWVYTSAWDGLPNVVIEAGAYGMPIVASAVDGIPELLDDTTGWPVQAVNDVQAYVSAIRDMLSDDDERISRAERLYRRVGERHVRARYRARFEQLEKLFNE